MTSSAETLAKQLRPKKDIRSPRSVRIDDALWEAAKVVAQRRGESVGGAIIRSLWAYVAPDEYQMLKEAREKFVREMTPARVQDSAWEQRYAELDAEIVSARAALDKAVEEVAASRPEPTLSPPW